MKNNKWLWRAGAGLIGSVMAINTVAVQTILPVVAQENASNQMVSDPEIVPVEIIEASKRTVSLNKNWKFILADPANAEQSVFDDSRWDSVNVPHDYSATQDYTPAGEGESGYKLGGVAWYRKYFTLGESASNKRVIAEFNGVYMDCTVYLNGHRLGAHPYGYTGFAFDLTDYLNPGGENVLAVRVNHQTPSSRWYSGSGIYRDVDLTITDPVHVAYNGIAVTTPNLATEKGGNVTTHTTTNVANNSNASKTVTLKQTVLAADGTTVGSASASVALNAGETKNQAVDVAVSNPSLWSTDTPTLYTLKTEVLDGDTAIDTVETTFGYRYYSYDRATGFKLNGQNVKLKGVCMHHDQGPLGSRAEDRAMERQVQILKKMGCNAIRITHNPGDPDFIAACSREGILVINELFDGWVEAKNGNSKDYARFFEQSVGSDNAILNKKDGDTWSLFDTRSAVEESRNEASVVMYSLCNEVFEGTGYGSVGRSAAIAQSLIDEIRKSDTERFVTFGGNQLKRGTSEDAIASTVAAAGGIVGTNYSQNTSYDSLYNNHSTWNLIGSETASHVNSRGYYKNQTSSRKNYSDFEITSYDTSAVGWGATAHSAWYDVITRDHVGGEFVWTGFDYLGEPTPYNSIGTGWEGGSTSAPKSSYFGIVDTAGLPKDNYYFYQSQWNDSVNTLHILPAWNRDVVMSGEKVPVWVYSDAASVELFFTPAGSTQRVSQGKKTFTKHTTAAGFTYQRDEDNRRAADEQLYMIWDIPYADGKLEAVAYDENGHVISNTEGRNVVETTGTASQLDLTPDRSSISADGSDLSYITIDVEDAQGRIVPSAKNMVTVSVEGTGVLEALDNGVQADHQSYYDDNRKAQAGQLVAVVRATENAGEIKVTASGAGLTSKTITINAQPVEEETGDKALTSFTYSKNYYVRTGTKPQLPAVIQANYSDGTSEDLAVSWDTVSDDQVAAAGSFGVSGTCQNKTVSVTVSVIDEVSTLLNVSLTTEPGIVPSLPESRRAVLNDGTILDASFPVTWQMPEDTAFASEGTVRVNGSAEIFGQSVPVNASVRVVAPTIVLGTSVTSAAEVTQSIPDDQASDTLDAVKDGNTTFNPNAKDSTNNNTSAWSNFNYSQTNGNDTSWLNFRYDTQTQVGKIIVHFGQDSYSAAFPDPNTITFDISDNGTDWQRLNTTEAITAGADDYNKTYTYTFDPVTYTELRMNIKNARQHPTASRNTCTVVAEVEQLRYTSSTSVYSSAELTALTVGSKEISAADIATKNVSVADMTGDIIATAKENGAITVLPIENRKRVILVEAEDSSKVTKYIVNYGVADPADDSRDIPADRLQTQAGSEQDSSNGAALVLDGRTDSYWHTAWSPKAPDDALWIVLKSQNGEPMYVDGLRYMPRQDMVNGMIYSYRIEALGADGTTWTQIAEGDWERTQSWHSATFDPILTTAVRLVATDSHGDLKGKHASAAELRLTGVISDGEVLDYDLLDLALATKAQAEAGNFKSTDAYMSAWNKAKGVRDNAAFQQQVDDAAIELNEAWLALRLNPDKAVLEALK